MVLVGAKLSVIYGLAPGNESACSTQATSMQSTSSLLPGQMIVTVCAFREAKRGSKNSLRSRALRALQSLEKPLGWQDDLVGERPVECFAGRVVACCVLGCFGGVTVGGNGGAASGLNDVT